MFITQMGRFATLLFFMLLGLTVNADTEPEIAANGVKYYLVQAGNCQVCGFRTSHYHVASVSHCYKSWIPTIVRHKP